MSDLLARGAALVGIGAGLMYALTVFSYQRFYGNFGITPSDVGITQSDIIAQTAAALTLVGSLTIVIISIVWLISYPIVAWLRKRDKLGSTRVVIAAAFSLSVIEYVPLAILSPVLRTWFGAPVALLGIFFINILAMLVIRQEGHWPPKALRNLGFFLGGSLPVLLLLGIFFTLARAEYLSTLVSNGYVFPPGSGFTFLFDIRADPVCVKGPPQSLGSGSRALDYFGRSGDLLVLYDPKRQKTTITPTAGIELVFPRPAFPYLSEFDRECTARVRPQLRSGKLPIRQVRVLIAAIRASPVGTAGPLVTEGPLSPALVESVRGLPRGAALFAHHR